MYRFDARFRRCSMLPRDARDLLPHACGRYKQVAFSQSNCRYIPNREAVCHDASQQLILPKKMRAEGEWTRKTPTGQRCLFQHLYIRIQSEAPSGEVHAGVESPLLEAAEAGAAEVEAGGDELHVTLLQDVLDHLRRGVESSRIHLGRTTRQGQEEDRHVGCVKQNSDWDVKRGAQNYAFGSNLLCLSVLPSTGPDGSKDGGVHAGQLASDFDF